MRQTLKNHASLKINAIGNYIGQIYTIFIGIIVLPFYLEHLGAEAYGLVGFFTMLMSWMALLDLGLSTTLAREASRSKDKPSGANELKTITLSIEALFSVVSAFIILGMLMGSQWISVHWLEVKQIPHATVEQVVIIIGFMLVTRWFVGLYQGCIIGLEQHIWLNKFKTTVITLKFVGGLIIVTHVSNDILHFFYYQLLISIIEFSAIRIKIHNNLALAGKAKPSIAALKAIAPFALSVAYTASVWLFVTQLDKLMLSYYLPLSEYGYFALIVVLSNGIMQMFHPIGQVVLPRLTSLISNGKEEEMIDLYHKSTQIVSVIVFAVSGMIAAFSYQLIYAWTGNADAATWGAPVLFWYALGNGAACLLSFQYFLQYAHGDLKYHVKGNTYFGLFQIMVILVAVHFYGAQGAGVAWFGLQTFFLLWWPGFIHSKFAPGIHKNWVLKDILPILSVSTIYILTLRSIDFSFSKDRLALIATLISMGAALLFLNGIASSEGRRHLRRAMIKMLTP